MLGFDGGVKLVDFGVAKALGELEGPRTRTGTVRGKAWYLAPEQIRGEAIDGRADLFSLGVVLHEALTGRRLFKAPTPSASIARILHDPIDPPSRWNARVTPELDSVCLTALSRDRGARYQDAEHMIEALEPQVRKLGWGPRQLTAFLARCAPRGPGSSPVDHEQVTVAEKRLPAPRPSRRGRWLVAATAAFCVAASTYLLSSRVPPPEGRSERTDAAPIAPPRTRIVLGPETPLAPIPGGAGVPAAGIDVTVPPVATPIRSTANASNASRRKGTGPRSPAMRRTAESRSHRLPVHHLTDDGGLEGRDVVDPF
jgi:hypothetical protein